MPFPCTAVIIDDEKLAVKRLQRLLQPYQHSLTVTGEAHNGEEGLRLVEAQRPDVLFLDIEMPGLNGFQLLSRLQRVPVVVFVTAFEAYAVRAFEENSVDYLLKPVEPERLAVTVEKLKRRLAQAPDAAYPQQLWQLVEQLKPRKVLFSIPVKIGDRILFVPPDEVSYLEAEDKYVYLHTLEGKRHLLDHSLTTLEEKLPEHFVRISRSVIVNRKQIREIQRHLGGRFVLLLHGKEPARLTSGASYQDKVKSLWEL
jgi:two-component system LytT family response regulator